VHDTPRAGGRLAPHDVTTVALALALGLILDALGVRALLVPVVLALLGRRKAAGR